ncbi:MAG: molybdopterin molybdotransferase MoeA [Acidobacteria bacterium]|nr:molybdopterin molybdotransferase MoeA [Acidobacteriota bacterium]
MRSSEIRSTAKTEERIVEFDAALGIVLEQAGRLPQRPAEAVALSDSLGRVLADPVRADRDQPPFNRSTRDGFAVHTADTLSDAWLTVVGQVRAGERWSTALKPGEAVETMTGAPVPEGADAVVMVEHVERSSHEGRLAVQLTSGRTITAGENVVPQGSEARAGDLVLPAGTQMDGAAIALAAACGAVTVKVSARPRVSIIATGDELVDVTETPGPVQIRNSNSYGLAALVTATGGEARRLPVAPDRREELKARILQACDAEMLLLSGGVSMGEYDLVEEVLLSLGAEFLFTGVKMQPGKPLVFGWLPMRDGRAALPFFGLPGNPVSTQVTFACFVEPLLHAMRGAAPEGPRFAQATLANDVDGRTGLTRVLPARLDSNRIRPEVRLVVWQGSGDMAANARANCYAVLPPGTERFRAGDIVTVLLK